MKRQSNTTAVKVKYLGATDTKGSRIKITQLNSCKSVILPYRHKYDTLKQIECIFESLEMVKSYRVIIDNTQNDYYIISFEFEETQIPDLIQEIKKQRGK